MSKKVSERNKRDYLPGVKIGIFFLIAIFLVFFGFLSIKEFSFFKGSYIIKIEFDFAEGLKPASPVRFCGVDVGEVKKIEVNNNRGKPTVYVYAKVFKDISIPRDSKFFINSLSLFGEKYLEIIPRRSLKDYVKPGETVKGNSSVPLYNIFSTFNQTILRLDKLIRDPTFRDSLEKILSHTEDFTSQLSSLLVDIRKEKGTIGKLFYDDSLYNKTEELIEDIKAHPWKLLYRPKGKKR